MPQLDYLPEDPPISGQKYALISIVGPHMKQKCDVWGLKIRGFSNSTQEGAKMVKKLQQINNHFDIFLVEVGKFFPLIVDPLSIDNIEYQNKELNSLIKGYIESRENAADEFHSRKNILMKEAIREGKEHEEDSKLATKEHPIAVLKRKKDLQDKIKDIQDQLSDLQTSVEKNQMKFDSFTEEERLNAEDTLLKAIKENLKENETTNEDSPQEFSPEQIREQILKEFNTKESEISTTSDIVEDQIHKIVSELQIIDTQIENDINTFEIGELRKIILRKEHLKKQLSDFDHTHVQNYMDSKWQGESKFSNLF
jgi:hypothetical protein